MIAEQKMVYATLNQHIQSGAIHALTIKAYTPDEWAAENS
jgi:acid stress-induced BolA-like protein IbaG/YrbA